MSSDALSESPVTAGPWVPDVNSGTCARQLSNGKVQGCGCRPGRDPNERCHETTPVVESFRPPFITPPASSPASREEAS